MLRADDAVVIVGESFCYFAENALNLTPEWLLLAGLRLDNIRLDRSILNATSGVTSAYSQSYDPL
ncbi:MAG: hypothetical protein V4692_14335, partial [Bdellovibrionota bacterium]